VRSLTRDASALDTGWDGTRRVRSASFTLTIGALAQMEIY